MLREVSLGLWGLYALLTLLWLAGGVGVAGFAFRLRPVERGLVGAALGMAAFETAANAAAHFLPLEASFWGAALLVAALGLCAWLGQGRPFPHWPGWTRLRQGLAGYLPWLALGGILWPIQRGLALFDEFLHLPLVAEMARGYVPPPFYLDPALPFAYHYGLHLWAASLVRMAGWFPWAALDAGKALTLTLSAALGWWWFYRQTHSRAGAWWGALALLLGSGTRWMLLLLPSALLSRLSAHIVLEGSAAHTGATLAEALARTWNIEGVGTAAFPFAFHGGLTIPMAFSMANTAGMGWMTLLALLLVGPRLRSARWPGWALTALAFLNLALSAEHLFAALGGMLLWAGWMFWRREGAPPSRWRAWGGLLLLTGGASLWQGGYLTVMAQEKVARWLGNAPAPGANAYGFSWRWPPGLPTPHFGSLSLFDPAQLLLLLSDFGPVLLLLPFWWIALRRALKRQRWMTSAAAGSVVLLLGVGLLIRYDLDRSMTRMPESASRLLLFLGWPAAWMWFRRAGRTSRRAARLALGAALLGGSLFFALSWTVIPAPQFTYFVDREDALMAQAGWTLLPEGAQVLDRDPSRSVTLFGWPTRAFADVYRPYPEWEVLVSAPEPGAVVQQRYGFVYVDWTWAKVHWPEEVLRAYKNAPCVRLAAQTETRRLFDVRACAGNAP